jgi:hypothetical protein
MEIQLHELISWGITIMVTVSTLLSWWNRRKKHSEDYMIIQGLMRGISEYSKFYAHTSGEIDRGNLQPTKDSMKMILDFAYSANNAIMQQVLGIIKSFGVKKDVPIDAQEFILGKKEPIQSNARPQT